MRCFVLGRNHAQRRIDIQIRRGRPWQKRTRAVPLWYGKEPDSLASLMTNLETPFLHHLCNPHSLITYDILYLVDQMADPEEHHVSYIPT